MQDGQPEEATGRSGESIKSSHWVFPAAKILQLKGECSNDVH